MIKNNTVKLIKRQGTKHNVSIFTNNHDFITVTTKKKTEFLFIITKIQKIKQIQNQKYFFVLKTIHLAIKLK